jgi:hypothetical protein
VESGERIPEQSRLELEAQRSPEEWDPPLELIAGDVDTGLEQPPQRSLETVLVYELPQVAERNTRMIEEAVQDSTRRAEHRSAHEIQPTALALRETGRMDRASLLQGEPAPEKRGNLGQEAGAEE